MNLILLPPSSTKVGEEQWVPQQPFGPEVADNGVRCWFENLWQGVCATATMLWCVFSFQLLRGFAHLWHAMDLTACRWKSVFISQEPLLQSVCECDAMLCLQCVVMVCYACHIWGFYNPTSLMWAEDLYSQDSPLARQLIQSIARQPHDRIMFGDLGGQLLGLVDISTWWSLFIHTI